MSGFADTSGTALTTDDPTEQDQHKVAQVVLRQAIAEGWTKAELMQVFGMLGLVPTESAGKYDPNGKHRFRGQRPGKATA